VEFPHPNIRNTRLAYESNRSHEILASFTDFSGCDLDCHLSKAVNLTVNEGTCHCLRLAIGCRMQRNQDNSAPLKQSSSIANQQI
jgi:hypothetical protein